MRFKPLLLFAVLLALLPGLHTLADNDKAQPRVVPEIDAVWHQLIPAYPDNDYANARDRSYHEITGSQVAVAQDGAVYVLCSLYRGGGPTYRSVQALLVKYSQKGERLWHRTFGEIGGEYGYTWTIGNGLALDEEGNVYVAGSVMPTPEAGFAVCLSPQGKKRWDFQTKPAIAHAESGYQGIAVNGKDVYLVGTADGQVAENAKQSRYQDALVTRLRIDGRHVWTHQYQGAASEDQQLTGGVTVTPKGLICFTGQLESNPVPGDFTKRVNLGYVMAIDPSGRRQWVTPLGVEKAPADAKPNAVTSQAYMIDADADGNLYVISEIETAVGWNRQRRDVLAAEGMVITRLSATGAFEWSSKLENMGDDLGDAFEPGQVRVDKNKHIWVAGTSDQRPAIVRFNEKGEFQSGKAYAKNPDYLNLSMHLTPDGLHAVVKALHFPEDASARRFDPEGKQIPQINEPQAPEYIIARLELDLLDELEKGNQP